MKYPFIATILLLAILSPSAAQDPEPRPDPGVGARAGEVQDELDELRRRVAVLEADLAAAQELDSRILLWFEGMTCGAKAMADVLDEAEAGGFAAGINHESREVLLAGWREHLAALRKGAPAAPKRPEGTGKSREEEGGGRQATLRAGSGR